LRIASDLTPTATGTASAKVSAAEKAKGPKDSAYTPLLFDDDQDDEEDKMEQMKM
jgi:hypothetical protein